MNCPDMMHLKDDEFDAVSHILRLFIYYSNIPRLHNEKGWDIFLLKTRTIWFFEDYSQFKSRRFK